MRAHKTYKGIRTCNSNESLLDFEDVLFFKRMS